MENPFEIFHAELVSMRKEIAELKEMLKPEQAPEIIDGTILCERLNINRQTLAKWRKQRKIPFIETTGTYRYNYPKVIEMLEGKKGWRE